MPLYAMANYPCPTANSHARGDSTCVRIADDNTVRMNLLELHAVPNRAKKRKYQGTGQWSSVETIEILTDEGGKFIEFNNGPGLYEISFYFWDYVITKDIKLWTQWVYVPYGAPSLTEAQKLSLAQDYAPAIIFNDGEEYFPQGLDDILNYGAANPDNTITITTVRGTNKVNMGDPIFQFLPRNAHANGWFDFRLCETQQSQAQVLNCARLFLRGSYGEKSDVTVYYDISEEGEKIYLTYFYFYAFDTKNGTDENPGTAAHAFDRESVTITFDSSLTPLSVTYGAHLESQTMRFYGCSAESLEATYSQIEKSEDALVEWSGGRMQLDWENAPKYSGHPAIYLARGSHAIFPAPGWYQVSGALIGFIPYELYEPAGITDGFEAIIPELLRLGEVPWLKKNKLLELDMDMKIDMELEGQEYLAFSGAWVDILGLGQGARFPPFTKRAPYSYWTENADRPFDECIKPPSPEQETTKYYEERCVKVREFFETANAGILNRRLCMGPPTATHVNEFSASASLAGPSYTPNLFLSEWFSLVPVQGESLAGVSTEIDAHSVKTIHPNPVDAPIATTSRVSLFFRNEVTGITGTYNVAPQLVAVGICTQSSLGNYICSEGQESQYNIAVEIPPTFLFDPSGKPLYTQVRAVVDVLGYGGYASASGRIKLAIW